MHVIMRAGKCGHHFDPDCGSCQLAIEVTDAEMDRLRSHPTDIMDEVREGLKCIAYSSADVRSANIARALLTKLEAGRG